MKPNETELKLLSEIMQLKMKLESTRRAARESSVKSLVSGSSLPVYSDLPTLAPVFTLRAHSTKVHDVVWSDTDQYLLTVGAEGLIVVWDTTVGLIHNVLDGTSIQPVTAASSGDARQVFCGGLCANVVLFQSMHQTADEGYSIYENHFVYEHSSQVNSIRLLSGSKLLTGAANDGALIWDIESVKVTGKYAHNLCAIECLGLLSGSEEANIFLTGASDGQIRQWDIRQPESLVSIFEAHSSTVNCIRPLPNGYNFVSGSEDTEIHLYDTRTDVILATYSDPHYPVSHTSLAEPDSISIAHSEGPLGFESAGVSDIAVSPSGRLLISGCKDWGVYYWDVAQPNRWIHYETEIGPVIRVAMSNRKTALAMMTWDPKTRIRIMRPH
ncbi:G protein subunit beta [Clonorchis sinensis]|uniref:Guanine nucleotide binding protein (G protein) beta other n=2 Tax=Clonorchis sinensis TaxID=79923 RepID=H2KU95_CLOSI|nr:G protein subunit beta [Clonorchis sinensis]GAA35784.2 guanine nucleotide binding protein (G protein) beta other [Clonorchis sinensis]